METSDLKGEFASPGFDDAAGAGSLPTSLIIPRSTVRIGLLRRLSASRTFSLGDRAGVLSSAQRRSGRTFRLDVRQRVIVKALISRHAGAGRVRGAGLARHLAYLSRDGAGVEGARPSFFDGGDEPVSVSSIPRTWREDRHHFRFIISPEHGDRIVDLRGYVREVMGQVAADLGEPGLTWLGVCHFDTDQPHAHVLVRGRRRDGRDLVIPRDYMAYGFRARAQEMAQVRLGDLSRPEAERRVWSEATADRFTGLDRRLIAAADLDGEVPDGIGRSGAWEALTRGRLRHLETLGLATWRAGRYRLAADLEQQLRTLQLRRDVIRTLNARRLESSAEVVEVKTGRVRGEVVRSGFRDALGAAPYAIVRDASAREHLAILKVGQGAPSRGWTVELTMTDQGVLWGAVPVRGRSLER